MKDGFGIDEGRSSQNAPGVMIHLSCCLEYRGRGDKADIAQPLHGLGSGVFEIALPFRGDAFRLVYAVQIANDIWVVHAFQKKSTKGIQTPRREIEVVRDRLKRLKEVLR